MHGERPTKKRQAPESPSVTRGPTGLGGTLAEVSLLTSLPADVKRNTMWSTGAGNPKKLLGLIHDQVAGSSSSGIFLKDIAIHEYDQLIKQPISLASIKRRITGKTDPITTMEEYMAEVFHMVCNAIMFNGPHTTTHEDAFKVRRLKLLISRISLTPFSDARRMPARACARRGDVCSNLTILQVFQTYVVTDGSK